MRLIQSVAREHAKQRRLLHTVSSRLSARTNIEYRTYIGPEKYPVHEIKRGNARYSRQIAPNHIVSPTPQSQYNENKAQMRKETTTQYYRDHDIHEAAKKESVRLKATALLTTGKIPDTVDYIRTAQYLQTELPVRVAHRIKAFHNLPFVIVTNPKILGVMELYMRSFKIISSFNDGHKIHTHEEVRDFENLLERLLDDHNDVIDELTSGFKDCESHVFSHFYNGGEISEELAHEKASALIQKFLDRTFTSRLGIRMLVEHHLQLSDQAGRNSRDRIGIVFPKWRLQQAIDNEALRVREMCRDICDNPPRVIYNGHTTAEFPYIPMGVDYILREIFKNAYRATIKSYMNSAGSMQPIVVTIAVNTETFTIRISDRGKGIRPEIMDKIFRYNFSYTQTREGQNNSSSTSVGNVLSFANSGNDKELGGYGVGLPISKAYAEYLGGSLEIRTIEKIGTDVYLTLKHIDPKEGHSFRI